MLDIKYIRENAEEVKKNNKRRGVKVDIDHLLELDAEIRKLKHRADEIRALRNKNSKTKPTQAEIKQLRKAGDEVKDIVKTLEETENKLRILLVSVPNLTHPDVPDGGEDDFKILETHGGRPKFNFDPKDHEELLTKLGLIDFERGAKVAGSRFYFLQGDLVRLNHALINYGIDVVSRHGFLLIETPDIARDDILRGIGFSPRGPETQTYSIEKTDLSLIGTAEITMGGYHAGEILDLSAGPKKYVALSHCFRTEAGAYGRVSKGLYRVHQFTKLEMFIYCKPEDGEELHREILAIQKEIVDGLQLPYRVIDTAAGGLGGPAYRKYDIEAWLVMKDGYGEITSTSNCTDYQARRLNVRYRNDSDETEFVHTLNGTAVVLSRFPLAIAENYQTEAGNVRVPEILEKYMGGLKEIKLR